MTTCTRLYLTCQWVASYDEREGAERLLTHLTRLREACELAVSKGYGILMALWEEPAPKAS
jgi:hypothetical protein